MVQNTSKNLNDMEKRQITLKDIARELRLSPSTVSRALGNHPAISAKTRSLVQKYASEHRYKPNALALQLRTRQNNTIGVIIPEIVHYFFSTVLAGIQDEAEKENYNLIICHSNENYKREVKSVQTLLDARVCGILASQSKTTERFDHFQEIIDNNVHLVFFDRICTGINTDKVVVDDYVGAFNAVDYLAKSGCRRIAFLGSSSSLTISNNRRMGYEDALRKNNLQPDKSLIYMCDTIELAKKIIPRIAQQPHAPDALFCINDEVAAYCMNALKSEGYRIPQDISICGFTNSFITELTDPAITSVEQHGYEMGKAAARLLINRVEGKETKQGIVSKLIKTELAVKKSTR